MLKATDLVKFYRRGSISVPALKSVNFHVNAGEHIAVMGASGSGKTSLLHILGTLDRADSGTLFFDHKNLSDLPDAELSHFRRRKMGFVFQSFNLLTHLTALENVAWPLILDSKSRKSSLSHARALLKKVGLDHRADHFPNELSGGEMQRIAIARALVGSPQLILADEPTGNLDSKTGQDVLNLLLTSLKSEGGALVMVTHDAKAASFCDRTVILKDGLVHV